MRLPKAIEPANKNELVEAVNGLKDYGFIGITLVGSRNGIIKLTDDGRQAYKIIFESDKLLEKEYWDYFWSDMVSLKSLFS